jgi:hypothetical protein
MLLNHKLEPCYKILKYAAGSNILLSETPWFKNILTDQGFENWVGSTSTGTETLFAYCGLGNGTGTPTATDSTISAVNSRFGKVVGADSLETVTAAGNILTCITAYITPVATSSYSVSEVGIFNAPSSGILVSRALIKDVTGTPTSITINPGEYLKVLYQIQVTVDLADKTGSFVWNTVTYNWTARPMSWNTGLSLSPKNTTNFWVWPKGGISDAPNNGFGLSRIIAHESNTLAAITSRPTYSSGQAYTSNISLTAYTANSKARKVEYILGASQGNIAGGIGGIILDNSSYAQSGFQIAFTPKIPKVSPTTFKIGITHQFSR